MDNIKENPKSRWTILFVAVLATFMATLDGSIVNVALPVMSDKLQVTSESISWVVSAYLIAISASILIFGKLGDLFGQTKVFQFGIALFTLGSLLCGTTRSFEWLIVARVIQAVGASGTMANSLGIITRAFPDRERGRALGINGSFVALGSLVGPPLGGLIISVASWEYMFWINVPIGIIVFILGIKVYPRREKMPRKEKMDVRGAVLLVIGMVPLFVALEQSITLGFRNAFILICLAVAAVGLWLFFALERKTENALFPLGIFKNKWFSVSIFCSLTSFVAIFVSNILLPFYLQDLLKLSPGYAGLFMAIYPLVLMVAAPVSGYLSDKIGSEILTLVGLLITSSGLYLMATLNENTPLVVLGMFIGMMALGNGLFQSPNSSLVMASIDRKHFGIGGSVNALIRNVGMVVGIMLSTMILYGAMSSYLGYSVSDFVEGAENAFIYGMQFAYIAAGSICMVGVIMTAFRLHARRKESKTV